MNLLKIVSEIQKKSKCMIGIVGKVAFKKGWIDDELLNKIIQKNQNICIVSI